MTEQHIKPTIVYPEVPAHQFGDQVSVWPAIPGVTGPAIQIDSYAPGHKRRRSLTVEFKVEDAPAIAAAIVKAAEESK